MKKSKLKLAIGNLERAIAWLTTLKEESDPLTTRKRIAANEIAEALRLIHVKRVR